MPDIERELKYLPRWFLWGPVAGCLQSLPYSMVTGIGRAIGRTLYRVHPPIRNKLHLALARFFPDMKKPELISVSRSTLENLLQAEFENMLLSRLMKQNFYANFPVAGLDRLDQALAHGSGAILVTAHFGAHLQMLPALGARGYTVNQVTNRRPIDSSENPTHRPPGFFEKWYFQAQEHRHGVSLPAKMISTSRFMRPLFEALDRNEVLVIAIDGVEKGPITHHPLLGNPTHAFSSGPVALALRRKCPLLPALVVRNNQGWNRLIIEEPIFPDVQQEREAEITKKTGEVVKIFEDYLRQYPDHLGLEIINRPQQAPPSPRHPVRADVHFK